MPRVYKLRVTPSFPSLNTTGQMEFLDIQAWPDLQGAKGGYIWVLHLTLKRRCQEGFRCLAPVVMHLLFFHLFHRMLMRFSKVWLRILGMFIQKRCLPSLATLNMMNPMEPNGSRCKKPIALGQRRLQLLVCPVHYLAWPGRVHQGWDEEPEARDDPSARRDQASAIGTIGHRHHELQLQCDLVIENNKDQ